MPWLIITINNDFTAKYYQGGEEIYLTDTML